MKKVKIFENKVNESLTLNDFKVGEKVNYDGSDMYIRTLDMEKGVGLSEGETGLITVGVIPERFLELVKKLDTPVNESIVDTFSTQDIFDIITNTANSWDEISIEDLTPEIIDRFKTGFNEILIKYPDYNPYDDKFDGEDFSMNISLSDDIIKAIKGKAINESANDDFKIGIYVTNTETNEKTLVAKVKAQGDAVHVKDGLQNAVASAPMKYSVEPINESAINENQWVKQKPSGKWGIISNKTGEFWDADYDTKKDAEDGFKAYQANKHR